MAAALGWGLGCDGSASPPASVGEAEALGEASRDVGLGLYFINGVHSPDLDSTQPRVLRLTDGPRRFLQELYIVSRAPTTPEKGLSPIMLEGDLAAVDWQGVHVDGEDWRLDFDGVHWTHQVYYRGARWMVEGSVLAVVPRNDRGDIVGPILSMNAGRDDVWKRRDDAFERRFVARVMTTGCRAKGDCSNAEATSVAEGLVQLRGAMNPHRAARIPSAATALTITWSADAGHGVERRVPLVHDAPGPIGYGLRTTLQELAPPARGYYLPKERLSARVRYTDDAGTALFPQGTLPTYGDAFFRAPAAQGLRYLGFNDVPILYWAHKALQADMEISLVGPLDRMTRIGTTPITPASLALSQIPAADVEHDGYTGLVQIVPPTNVVFPCLLGLQGAPGGDPSKCSTPVTDVIGFDVPEEALPGTYSLQIKARREWQGEPVHAATSIRIQIGTHATSQFAPFPIPGVDSHCGNCHAGGAAIPVVGHGFEGLNAVGPECLSCHTSGYFFEPDADIVTRLQIIHSRSHRLGPPVR